MRSTDCSGVVCYTGFYEEGVLKNMHIPDGACPVRFSAQGFHIGVLADGMLATSGSGVFVGTGHALSVNRL